MKTEQEQIEAATMDIAREVCQYYNSGRCDLGSPTCHKTSIQLCPRKEAIVDSLNRIVKQAQIDVLNKIKNCREATDSDCYPYIERIVNKLIKEVQNGENKN